MTVTVQSDTSRTTRDSDPGWYIDPLEQHKLRYFDGTQWTDHVTHYGPEPCIGCAHLGRKEE